MTMPSVLQYGAAVPVRAFMESRLDAQTSSLDYACPGFDRAAVPTPAHGNQDILTNNLRPDARLGPSDGVRIGNNRTHILSIRRDGQNVTAIMRNNRYRLALEHETAST
jgi:hypothetical protein